MNELNKDDKPQTNRNKDEKMTQKALYKKHDQR